MALSLPTGEYITVEQATENKVTIRRHADAAHRERYKTGTETSFETTRQEDVSVAVALDSEPNATPLTIKAALITAGYAALKTLPEFAEGVDA
jgi:hypothetical protein